MTPSAFALARPASLGTFNKTVSLIKSRPVVRRRPRVQCKAAGLINPELPGNAAEFAQRGLQLARSFGSSNTLASQVQQELCRLEAFCAADLAFAELRVESINVPNTWRGMLHVLENAGVVDESLDRVIDRLGLCRVLSIDPQAATRVCNILNNQLKMAPGKLRRLIVRTPTLLESADDVAKVVHFLREMKLKDRDIQDIVVRWPAMLTIDVQNAKAVMETLLERELRGSLRRFLLRAPFVLLYSVDKVVKPALNWMRAHFTDVEHIVRGCPLVLGNSVSQFQAVKSFMLLDVGIAEKKFAAVIRAFPPLLVADEVATLRPALRFLRVDLGFSRSDAAHVALAFPATLVLDVDGEMRVNVEYFRGKGVENVCRIVRRLPPILSYDLEKDIVPKMEYLENSLRLSPFDALNFPAYFSYPLETRIHPRTMFLRAIGIPLSQVGLNMALSLNDKDFCDRVAQRPLKEYKLFSERLEELRTGRQRLRDKKLGDKKNVPSGVRVKVADMSNRQNAESESKEAPLWSVLFRKL